MKLLVSITVLLVQISLLPFFLAKMSLKILFSSLTLHCSDFGVEVAESRRFPDSVSRGVGDSLTRGVGYRMFKFESESHLLSNSFSRWVGQSMTPQLGEPGVLAFPKRQKSFVSFVKPPFATKVADLHYCKWTTLLKLSYSITSLTLINSNSSLSPQV